MSAYDNWLDAPKSAQDAQDVKDDATYQAAVERVTSELAEGVTGQQVDKISEHLLAVDFTPEQVVQLDKLIIKVALGLPVAPEDVSEIVTAGEIVDLLVGEL